MWGACTTPAPGPYCRETDLPFDLGDDRHQEARSRLEAEREYDAWHAGESYAPVRSLVLVRSLYCGRSALYLTHRLEDGSLSDRRVLISREDDL